MFLEKPYRNYYSLELCLTLALAFFFTSCSEKNNVVDSPLEQIRLDTVKNLPVVPLKLPIPKESRIIFKDSLIIGKDSILYAVVVENGDTAFTNGTDSSFLRQLHLISHFDGDLKTVQIDSTIIGPTNILFYGPGFRDLEFDSNGVLTIVHNEYTGSHYEDFTFGERYDSFNSLELLQKDYCAAFKECCVNSPDGYNTEVNTYSYNSSTHVIKQSCEETHFPGPQEDGNIYEEPAIMSSLDTSFVVIDTTKIILLNRPREYRGFISY